MWGGYPLYVAGFLWLTIWSLIAGFSVNEIMLNFCRALQGLGPAAFLPSSMMILGSIYRPGPRKNLVFSIYGACAPLGFFVGIFFAGVTGEYTTWGWYFWIGTILSAITALTAYLTVPSDILEKRNATGLKVEMDWLGSILIVSGLIIFTFAVIDSSHASTPSSLSAPSSSFLQHTSRLMLLLNH
jgi:MFS family permease